MPQCLLTLLRDTCTAPCSPIVLNTSTDADFYIWNLDNGESYSAFEPGNLLTERGTYTISLRAYNNMCEDSAEFQLIVLDAAGLQNPCDTMNCGAHGICQNGICQCAPDWEGPFCNQSYAGKLVGTYHQIDSCGSDVMDWPQVVTVSQLTPSDIVIDHFGYLPALTAMVVKENNTDAVARKIVFDQQWEDDRHLRGTGLVSGKMIHGNFTLTQKDGSAQSCTFTLLGN